jgi:hypothetical protein
LMFLGEPGAFARVMSAAFGVFICDLVAHDTFMAGNPSESDGIVSGQNGVAPTDDCPCKRLPGAVRLWYGRLS